MLKINKSLAKFYLSLLLSSVFALSGWSQINSVKFRLDYAAGTQQYDFYLIVEEGCTDNFVSRIQSNSQISIVAPRAASISVVENYNPLLSIGGQPMMWQKQNIAVQTDQSIDESYHSIVPSLNPTSAYTSICEGDEILLFSISVDDVKCDDEVRLWKNDIDPGTELLAGANFNNGFTVGSIQNVYTGNATPLTTPSAATPSQITICEGACTNIAVSECLYRTFNWSTGDATASINVCPTTPTTYNVTLTDFDNNMSVENYEVTIDELPTLDDLAFVDAICVGENLGTFALAFPYVAVPLDTDVIEKDEEGDLIAVGEGSSGFLVINSETGCEKLADLTVDVFVGQEVIPPSNTVLCIGDTVSVRTATLHFGDVWLSDNPSVAVITNSGVVTALQPGTVRVRHIDPHTGCYSSAVSLLVLPMDDPQCLTSTQNDHFKNLTLYPNPTADLFVIENLTLGSSIQVLDIFGRILTKETNALSTTMKVNTEDWNTGIYIVRVNSGSKKKALKLHVVR